MGVSDWALEIEEEKYAEKKAEWIRRELGDEDADEGTDGWHELEAKFDETFENWRNYIEDEYSWYNEQDFSIAHVAFKQSISDIRNILKSSISPIVVDTVYKMVYVHAVTALESYLGDTLKILVLQSPEYTANAAKHLNEIKDRKLKPADVIADKQIVEKLVLEQLSEYLYHNIVRVLEHYRDCLNFKSTYNLREMIKITSFRHDLVHRNGKDKQGLIIPMTLADVTQAIAEVERFVEYLDKELSSYRNVENIV